ncbi:hypothetical protein BH23PAT2_BH23PAT2_00020 [soil metagenome]
MVNHNTEPMNAEFWSETLRPVFQGKKVILAGEVIAALVPRAKQIRELGAQSTFMLATEGMGTGDTPTKEDGEWFALDAPHFGDIVEAIHAGQKLLSNLPQRAKAALDQYDQDNEAIVVGSFLHERPTVGGRKSLAYRKPEWLALDDKTIIDQVWDKIGVSREQSEVIEVSKVEISEATQKLNAVDGVVLSGDSREGVSGGAVGTRWIHSETDIDKVLEYYTKHCDRLRVMPFLEGIPCAIHGMVFPDYIAAFRPVEMMTLRKSGSNEFFYAGTATYWDPAPSDRDYMRDTARKVGNALREMVDYRGIFTIDGVLTKDGFRPTELNPRSGAGINPILAGMSDFPLELIAQALVAGADVDFKPKELETFILKGADEQRGGGTWSVVRATLPHVDKRGIKRSENGWAWSKDDNPDGTVTIGHGPLGSFVRLVPNNSSIQSGSSFAPIARDFWQFVDENMNSNIGLLKPAKSVR